MTDRQRALLALHGGILVLIALLSGFFAVLDEVGGGTRSWRSVHQTLLIFGAWLLATAGAAPAIRLAPREATGLLWSLASSGYAMVLVLGIRATNDVTGLEFGNSTASRVAFVSNLVVVLGATLAALLIINGAWSARRQAPGTGGD